MTTTLTQEAEGETLTLLVIASPPDNYYELFADVKALGTKKDGTKLLLRVEQACWDDVNLTSYSDSSKLVVELSKAKDPLPNTPQNRQRTIKPSFLLVRNTISQIAGRDYRNLLFGFMHANIPSINSTHALMCFLERPVVHAALRQIEERVGSDKFPLIPQNFYPNFVQMNFSPDYPIVVKCGNVHAGYGKMLLEKHSQFEDLRTVLALHKQTYATAEHFYESEYDLRIQKIGDNYRAYKRYSVSSWKGNMGTSIPEDVPMTAEFKLWVDECSKIFGGIDIFAVDAIYNKETGKTYILEVNDSSIGLGPAHAKEDTVHIKNLVLQRMKEHFLEDKVSQTTSTSSTDVVTLPKTEYETLQVEIINHQNTITGLKEENAELASDNQRLAQDLKQVRANYSNYYKQQQHASWRSNFGFMAVVILFSILIQLALRIMYQK